MKEILAVKEYTSKDGTNKSIWIRIGSGFENKDGSINLLFDAFPCNPQIKTIQLREAKPKEDRPSRQVGGQTFTAAELEPDSEISF